MADPVPGFWTNARHPDGYGGTSNQGNVDLSELILDSVGDQQIAAQERIPGTSHGARPAEWIAAARAVYPVFTGQAGANAMPGTRPPLTEFDQWHSAYQREYLAANGNAYTSASGATYFLSTDGQTVYNVLTLGLSDVAQMSAADQTRLSTLGAPFNDLKARLNVDLKANVTAPNFTLLRNDMTGLPTADLDTFKRQITLLETSWNNAVIVKLDSFNQEVGDVLERFNRARDFGTAPAPTNLNVALFTITEGNRNDIKKTELNVQMYNRGFQDKAVSSDELATVRQGYAEFMRAERAILSSKEARAGLSATAAFSNPRLDVPNLIFRLQSLYETQSEGIADGGTELLKQVHKLLDDISIMQTMINNTIQTYDPKKSDEKRRFLDVTYELNGNGTVRGDRGDNKTGDGRDHQLLIRDLNGTTLRSYTFDDEPSDFFGFLASPTSSLDGANTQLTREQLRIFSMFDKNMSQEGHPAEKTLGLPPRPTIEFWKADNENDASLVLQFKTFWDTQQTKLSDHVTQINQKTQVLQNEIDNSTKQQNRHFELANNALRKMNDMLLTIGRI